MSLNFPANPSLNDVYTDSTSGFSYQWNGDVWKSYTPSSSNQILILDDISGSFNGSTQTFPLTYNSSSFTPGSAQSLIINLGGVVQDPSDDYSVSGSNITFSTPPAALLTFSAVSLGSAITVNTVSDGAITPAKLSTGGPSWDASGNLVVSGGIQGIGIQSAGVSVYTGIVTALNFVGTGNTFAVNGTTVDISISGGGGAGVSSTGILTCRGIANASLITDSITLDDYYNAGTNYAMVGPIEVSVGATITVGAGVSYVVV